METVLTRVHTHIFKCPFYTVYLHIHFGTCIPDTECALTAKLSQTLFGYSHFSLYLKPYHALLPLLNIPVLSKSYMVHTVSVSTDHNTVYVKKGPCPVYQPGRAMSVPTCHVQSGSELSFELMTGTHAAQQGCSADLV